MRKSKPMTRAEKAVIRLAEVISGPKGGRAVVVHLFGAHRKGTVGPYHKAVGEPNFAMFTDAVRVSAPRDSLTGFARGLGCREYPTAATAADHAVAVYGVSNVITAIKAAARKHGSRYVNLDTPVWSA